jgi:hypothetical protein
VKALTVAALAMAACHSSHPHTTSDATADAAPDAIPDAFTPIESHALGMNDVTILLQLPDDPINGTTFARLTGFPTGTDLVPRDVFASLVTAPGDVGYPYEQFQAVAIRFDLCDRVDANPCPSGADGQLRLTFQPLAFGVNVMVDQGQDAALQAFYPVPAYELAPMIDELRRLARLYNFQTSSPLAINQGLSSIEAPSEYSKGMMALVAKYASAAQLTRLTLFSADANGGRDNWIFRGVELSGGAFQPISIPTISAPQQRAIFNNGYDVSPVADSPAGIQLSFLQTQFDAAPYAMRQAALAALAAAQNPTTTGFHVEQCVNCHAGTYLTAVRATDLGVDPMTVAGTYTSSHPLSISFGEAASVGASLRGLGWYYSSAVISQRVANETALVLDEIDRRFPPATPPYMPDAGVPDSPPNVKRVFVTDAQLNGDLKTAGGGTSGLDGADRICAAAAAYGHLGGTWVAWLSTSTVNAIDRLTDNGPWYLVDGTTLVFPNKAAIASLPMTVIDRDELDALPSGFNENVWTGTNASGALAGTDTCTDWTNGTAFGYGSGGKYTHSDSVWTDGSPSSCANAKAHLYCFEL